MTTEVATLGGGCFWCIEAVYQQLKGVQLVESGYTGGHVKEPNYAQVCEGTTGHAEVVRLTFDENIISFKKIIDLFFKMHDPTQKDMQYPDVGTQYRSEIFYETDQQKQEASKILNEFQKC